MAKQTLKDLSLTDLQVLEKRFSTAKANADNWFAQVRERMSGAYGPLNTSPPDPDDVKKATSIRETAEKRLTLIEAEINSRIEDIFT